MQVRTPRPESGFHGAAVATFVGCGSADYEIVQGEDLVSRYRFSEQGVRCALALQDAVAHEADLHLHLGIHVGDVVRVGEEISGDGVNVARRICALSEGGGLCVSAEVWHAVRNHEGLRASALGPQELKNVGRPVEAFALERVGLRGEGEGGAAVQPARSPRARRLALAAAGVVLAGVVLVGWLGSPRLEPPAPTPVPAANRASPSSLAVLPFADMSPERDQEHFSDGLSEEILNALARVDGLRVVARTSSFAFKGRDEDVRAIGAKLSVGRLVEGSVRRAGNKLRITAQLVDTRNGFHLWSQTYDRRIQDVFSVQEDIARSIVQAVKAEVSVGPAPVRAPQPRDFRAYQLYLRGVGLLSRRSTADILEAVRLFEEAIAVDPAYADAHAALAHARILSWDYASRERRDGPSMALAEAAASRAIELDPERAAAQASFANVRSVRYLDWPGAEEAYLRALALNPGLASAREQYAAVLMQTARLDEARVQLLTALEADPLSPIVNRNVGRVHLYLGDHVRALQFLWRSLELDPDEPIAPSLLFITYVQMGREDEAIDAIVRRAPALTRPFLRTAGRLFGLRPVAAALLGAVRLADACPMNPTYAAQFYAYLDWSDAMIRCLEQSFHGDLSYLAVNPLYDSHRDDPRFAALLSRAGLGSD